jgi:plastocyanin/uncharacterized membrane protein YozB (DUF420 family)
MQIGMGLALLGGMALARAGRYRAHGICQTIVVLLNLGVIVFFMAPRFQRGAAPQIPSGLGDPYFGVATAHAVLGSAAELLGLYVLLNAGTNVLPAALRFKNFRPVMRTTLVLWWAVIALGIGTYWLWHADEVTSAAAPPPPPREVAPPSAADAAPDPGPKTIPVSVRSDLFEPREIIVEVGDTVIWTVGSGRHTVTADDKRFDTPILPAGGEFTQVFDEVGTVAYYCELHGAPGGLDMAGVITVVARGSR